MMKDGGEPVYVSSRFVGLEIWQHLAYWKEALYGTHLRLSIVGAVDKGTGTATGTDASMKVCEAAFFFFFFLLDIIFVFRHSVLARRRDQAGTRALTATYAKALEGPLPRGTGGTGPHGGLHHLWPARNLLYVELLSFIVRETGTGTGRDTDTDKDHFSSVERTATEVLHFVSDDASSAYNMVTLGLSIDTVREFVENQCTIHDLPKHLTQTLLVCSQHLIFIFISLSLSLFLSVFFAS
jgi:hypothetical protein